MPFSQIMSPSPSPSESKSPLYTSVCFAVLHTGSSLSSFCTRDQTYAPYIDRQILIHWTTTAAAKSFQSCLTLCNPIEGSPPGSPVPGILQARTQEWSVISFSNA